MNKLFFVVLFALGFIFQGAAQKKIGDYTYIVVPQQYEFLKGKDTYRLNTFTRYELKQFGYQAVFAEELPGNIGRCDVLYLDAEGKGGLVVYTKITVMLKDCNGFEIFRTKEGKSKEKEYKPAYLEAMKKALASFEFLEDEISKSSEVTTDSRKVIPFVKDTVSTIANTTNKVDVAKTVDGQTKATYSYKDFKIVALENDFMVMQKDENLGTLIPTSQKGTYIVNTKAFTGMARQMPDGFVIEGQVPGSTELVTMKFSKNE